MLTKKEISVLEKSDTLILSIKKPSEPSPLEGILGHWICLPTAIYFNLIRRKRYNHIIVTNKSAVLLIRNKMERKIEFKNLQAIQFNSATDLFEFVDDQVTYPFKIGKYLPSFEEFKIINESITTFSNKT